MLGSESVTWRGPTRHFALAAVVATTIAPRLPARRQRQAHPAQSRVTMCSAVTARRCISSAPPRAVALNAAATLRAWAPTTPSPAPPLGAGRSASARAEPDHRGVLRCVRFDLPHGVTGVTPRRRDQDRARPRGRAGQHPEARAWAARTASSPPAGASTAPATTTASPSPRPSRPRTAGASPSRTPATPPRAAPSTPAASSASSTPRAASATPSPPGSRARSVSGASATRSCRSSEFSVSTGVSLPVSDDIFLTGTGPVGRPRRSVALR